MLEKLTAVGLLLGGALSIVLLYKIFQGCIRKAMFRGRKFLEFPGILCVLLYAVPVSYLALQEENLLPFSLSQGQFILLFIVCFSLATIVNLLRWEIPGGIGFCVCHLFLAGIVVLFTYLAIFAIFLLFAILAPTSSRREGFWIGASLFGNEFLVFSIGDGYYQDESLNTYQRMGDDTMLGSDGVLYYIHRPA